MASDSGAIVAAAAWVAEKQSPKSRRMGRRGNKRGLFAKGGVPGDFLERKRSLGVRLLSGTPAREVCRHLLRGGRGAGERRERWVAGGAAGAGGWWEGAGG